MNPLVKNLLRILAIHSRFLFLIVSVFYHPGQENIMADNASCIFRLSDTSFFAHVSVAYQKLHGS